MRSFTRGFTLVELLVVIVLIGLVTSMTVLSTGTASVEREMEEEAKRMHAMIKLVQEESIIQAKEIAMEIDKNEYSFLQQGEKEWEPMQEKVFHPHTLRDDLKLSVELENQTGIFKEEKTESLRIYFLSSGEQIPFTIKIKTINSDYPYYRLQGEFNGNLKLEHISDPLND